MPKKDPFFEDPTGVDRGRELFDVNGDFVAQENDLWVNRVNYAVGRPVTFPGDRPEDTVKAHLEMSMECDQPADFSAHEEPPCPELASESFHDTEMDLLIEQASNQENLVEQSPILQAPSLDEAQTPPSEPNSAERISPSDPNSGRRQASDDDDWSEDEDLMDDEWIDAAIQAEWEQIQSGKERVKTQVRQKLYFKIPLFITAYSTIL